jgi:hypothetical protein
VGQPPPSALPTCAAVRKINPVARMNNAKRNHKRVFTPGSLLNCGSFIQDIPFQNLPDIDLDEVRQLFWLVTHDQRLLFLNP